MSTAVLSLGSNVDGPLDQLRAAVAGLGDTVRAVSPVYRTAPVGGVAQDDFLNAVVLVTDDDTDAAGWLTRAQSLEAAAGRTRTVRWGPRTLDVDVVAVDGLQLATDTLVLPHPRAHERAFVLVPWLDVDPHAVLPGHGRVAALVAALGTAGVTRLDEPALPSRHG